MVAVRYNKKRHMVPQMFLRSLRLPIFLASRALSARPASNMTVREQPFDYFLVLDFEATCSREKPPPHPQEIIEFPVLKVNGRSFQVESTFHQYVQPRVHRELSSFCTELTGIIQDMVDEQPFLEEVLEKFHEWMCSEGLLGPPEKQVAFVTFGDWDLQKMLPSQCSYFKIPVPEYLTSWINLKKAFVEATGHWPKTLPETLEYCRLEQVGRHHSGIDDCHNIASVLRWLAEKGHVFRITGHLPSRTAVKTSLTGPAPSL